MPNLPSARKRMRTSAKRRLRNRMVKSRLHSLRRKFMDAVLAGDRPRAEACLRAYCSGLDKAVKKGVIKQGNANRKKSRAALKLKAVVAATAPHQ
ncbi:MAG: 30S ribosomal protein S20 [Kiritimatiellae bacterium]|nr:30S ribosomal protein S20 [Kiritimatiellia bacterium]